MTKLADLPLPPTLVAAIEKKGYVDATAVQDAVAHADVARDLLVTSQTGSGKTLAFGFSIASALLDDKGLCARHKKPRALVVAPTRELAQQVERELAWLVRETGARTATCVGGMDVRRELRALHTGAEIIVGTPGRLRDHIERKSLALDEIAVVVLDEADEMLDMGFRDELEAILAAAPDERRTLLFSATFPRPLEALAKRYMKEPARIAANKLEEAHADIETVAHVVAPREREHAVVNVLRFYDAPSTLVFCATREGTEHMRAALVERGFLAVGLSGELSQGERNRALHAVREGKARVLVATDVAARGLDLPAVALVVHADPPQNSEVLRHRSGRTGRAGKKGTAVILTPPRLRRDVERMMKDAHVVVRFSPAPTPKQIKKLDDARLVDETSALAAEPDLGDSDVVEQLVAKFAPNELASALARSLRRNLPAPEELLETAAAAKAPARGDRYERDDRHDRGGRNGRSDPRGRDGGGRDGGVEFRVNVGREQRADPKWLLPMLCRRGGITKRDLGRMDIGRRETKFTVNPDVAGRFDDAASKPDAKDPNIRIERC